jgi:membrane protein YqaA with SNARE-associated domain
MDFALSPEAGLAGLFLASFLAATLLPGGSEAALAAFVMLHPQESAAAMLLATLGNTAGGMSSYALGRFLPAKVGARRTAQRHHTWLVRFGPAVLLLSWVPLIGDALCVAAGWLRLRWLPCLLWMTLGKGLRYLVIIEGTRLLSGN